ncbi:MAG: hypothetical protein LQ345_002125 [Seirophora villosa]|nr:MAG: hypothetical protein LQ345_002125 [Seirophora villosa]
MAQAVDLWTKAVDSLSPEDRQAIDFSRVEKSAILSDVLHAAEQKKQTCMQKRWKFTKQNGDIVIVRDVCEKLIKWVNKFKEAGDVAVQYDPAHASLPWAAVRFLLQTSVNDVQTFGAMAEGLELVSSQITQCALYEPLYLSRSSTVRSDLEAALLRLYTVILQYLARALRYYTKKTIHRLAASLIDTSESVQAGLASIAVQRDEVERCTRLVDSELSIDTAAQVNQVQVSVNDLATDLKSIHLHSTTLQKSNHQALKGILASLEQPILRAGSQLSDLHVELQKEQRTRILSWLSKVSWLRQKAEYVDWKASSISSILWIHGIPGSGKSKLLSTVVQGLIEGKAQPIPTSAVAYFYCTRDTAEPQRADPDEVMRAVLKQLACFNASQPIHPAVMREYDKRKKDADEDGLDPLQLSLHDCNDLVLEITDQLPAIIIIDALDECDPLRRHKLLKALRHIVVKSNNLVKVLVSSRDDEDIGCQLNNVPNVYIRSDDNSIDVERYIDQELKKAISEQRLLQGRVPDSLQEQILSTLKNGAKGMFLWVSLQMQNLCDPERMKIASDVEDALSCLPPTLSHLYKVILKRIDNIAPRGQSTARKALRWLLCAREPLTPRVLIEILEFNWNNSVQASYVLKEEVLSLCCNLVVLDDSLNVYRFAHASVREFLGAQPGFDSQENNIQAAEEALHFVQNRPKIALKDEGDFARYACNYWITHYGDLDFDFRSKHPLSTVVKNFFNRGSAENSSFHWWRKSMRILYATFYKKRDLWRFFRDCDNPFHYACNYGLLEVINELADKPGADLNVKNLDGETGLHIAVSQQYYGIVERLLILGSDPRMPDRHSTTALHVAVGDGAKPIVQLLLQHGADVMACDRFGETALHCAVEKGDTPIVLLLLQHGADAMACAEDGFTALDCAAQGHHKDVVRLLIVHGAAEEASQKYGENLVNWARSVGDEEDTQRHFLHLMNRATGLVGVRDENRFNGRIAGLMEIVYLLYSLQDVHLHLKIINKVEDRTPSVIAKALEDLLTRMETSDNVVSTEELNIALRAAGLDRPGGPLVVLADLVEHLANITSGHKTTSPVNYNDLFWSEIVYSEAGQSPAPAPFLEFNVDGNRHLEEAISKWADSPNVFEKLAPVLIIKLSRDHVTKASCITLPGISSRPAAKSDHFGSNSQSLFQGYTARGIFLQFWKGKSLMEIWTPVAPLSNIPDSLLEIEKQGYMMNKHPKVNGDMGNRYHDYSESRGIPEQSTSRTANGGEDTRDET